MKNKKIILILSICIAILSGFASSTGIFSKGGRGEYQFTSIRGETVTIYGKGIYKDMSNDVAPQGIAQDIITLFLALPILLISLISSLKGSIRGRFILAGTIGYFLVTYLFYLAMAMYNELFIVYIALSGLSFFALYNILQSFEIERILEYFNQKTPAKSIGTFLLAGAILIALMWLSIILPPLFNGTVIPKETAHYTTLIVQGFDLGLLLPIAMVSAILFRQRKPKGFLFASVYFIFLSLLTTALSAKVFTMYYLGYNIIPAIFIIPVFNIITIILTIIIILNIKK